MAALTDSQENATVAAYLREYERIAAKDMPEALKRLIEVLAGAAPSRWQACAAGLQKRGAMMACMALLERAIERAPAEASLRLQLGQLLIERGDHAGAERVLRPAAALNQEEVVAALASALRNQGKLSQASRTMADLIEACPADMETSLGRLRFINGCQRQALAAEMCQLELGRWPRHPRLNEFAGRMKLILGRFTEARAHYLAALDGGIDLDTAFVLQALSGCQRYGDAGHPDFALFRQHLEATMMTAPARASILFAQGKANDDIGDFAAAATAFREANALIRNSLRWSRRAWAASVEDLMNRRLGAVADFDKGFIPVFVVGMPRSGTTLVADRLARHAQVRNRGELNLVPYLDQWVSGSGQQLNSHFLGRVADFASGQIRQDDTPARWYVDKNPLNFRYVGLIAALFPQSRFIYCRRDPRDTALSIWSQYFARGEDNGYAYDFADIAEFARGCERLMRHWSLGLGAAVHAVDYEELVSDPDTVFGELGDFLGLQGFNPNAEAMAGSLAITTSSAWQARQPIYSRSTGRWSAYAPFLPELVTLFGQQ